ncbi:DUF2335 domain-containing protein [Crenothrix polyspora]|uniref:Uncharacterized protein n=1 Tax=Crenothrix polyspora TaxID=360316 RepID=A0A1R4HFH8_9GAMM|nr:DUF2335 domain-containing protein [Crenothrix polyspora]SJM94995.1 hypothetical protein CRENPOLYSF1_610044 [Crenothrix polyspora]
MAKKPVSETSQNNRVIAATQTVTHYQGAVPHPDILRGIDQVVPGAAERLIKIAEEESEHRRKIEIMAIDANIYSQQQQLLIESKQSNLVLTSDLIGQIAGLIVCLSSIAAIPTAALIKAFVFNRK